MHKEILTKPQKKLLPIIKELSANFYLVGGTAIALHIGHRESIDFDLFTYSKFSNLKIRNLLDKRVKISKTLINELDQYTVMVNGVKITCLCYPFKVKSNIKPNDIIFMPDLLALAAMKAYALNRRAKWKDYVDLYFILKDYHSLEEIIKKAESIFKKEFSRKNFLSALSYFKDIDYSEKINYLPGFEVSNEKVKKTLKTFSLSQV